MPHEEEDVELLVATTTTAISADDLKCDVSNADVCCDVRLQSRHGDQEQGLGVTAITPLLEPAATSSSPVPTIVQTKFSRQTHAESAV